MSHPDHADNSTSLRRIEGQVRGVQQMIDDKRYCMDIVNQIKAIKSALSRVESKVLEKHSKTFHNLSKPKVLKIETNIKKTLQLF